MTDPSVHSIAVKDFAAQGIKLKVTCRTCGRERVIEGGLLPRTFSPEDRLTQYRINAFAKRLKCGNCGGSWPKAELGRWDDQHQGASPAT